MKTLAPALLLIVTGLGIALPVCAQPVTNLEAYQQLAVRCLHDVPDTLQAFRLAAPPRMPYLRSALVDYWTHEGHTLFLADSTAQTTSPMPLIRYAIEEASVTYARAGRRRFQRTVTLGLRYTLTTADGQVLLDDRCRDTFTDTIRRARRLDIESAAYPETQAEPPQAGWIRRYLEPALIATATAVTVYLFFNLRSRRADN